MLKQSRYAHARQFCCGRHLKTLLGRVIRDIQKMPGAGSQAEGRVSKRSGFTIKQRQSVQMRRRYISKDTSAMSLG